MWQSDDRTVAAGARGRHGRGRHHRCRLPGTVPHSSLVVIPSCPCVSGAQVIEDKADGLHRRLASDWDNFELSERTNERIEDAGEVYGEKMEVTAEDMSSGTCDLVPVGEQYFRGGDCTAGMCGDIGEDCCAPGDEHRTCHEDGFHVTEGGWSHYAQCEGWYGWG
eukprot:COSAG06_NODE_14888_length_1117_cov_1.028487_1_plen_164_part_10